VRAVMVKLVVTTLYQCYVYVTQKHISAIRSCENWRFWHIPHSARHTGHGGDIHWHAVLHESRGPQTRRIQL